MAQTFRKVARKVLAGKDAGKTKLYAMPISKGQMPLREVCELVSSRSSFSASDVQGILEGMSWSVGFLLRTGHSVQLGDLGCFRVSFSSAGVDTEEEFDASLIKQSRVLFVPGTMLRGTLADMEYTPFKAQVVEVEKVVEVEIPCDREHAA